MKLNRILVATGAAILLLTASTAGAADLLGYWPLDETLSPPTHPGYFAADLSYNGMTGVYQRGVTVGVPGALPETGLAMDCDGVDDEIFLGNPASLANIGNNFTLAAWIYPRADDVGTQRIFSSSASGGGGFGWGLVNHDFKFTTYGVKDYVLPAASLPLNAWSHVAMTFDADNDATFYINGVSLGTVAGDSPANPTVDNFFIGRTGIREPFNGMIDEMAVWGGVLSEAELAELAAGTLPNELGVAPPAGAVTPYEADADTALLYHFDHTSKSYSFNAESYFIPDAAGNANLRTNWGSSAYSPFLDTPGPQGLGPAAHIDTAYVVDPTTDPPKTMSCRAYNEAVEDMTALAVSDFTIEAWIRNPAQPAADYACIIRAQDYHEEIDPETGEVISSSYDNLFQFSLDDNNDQLRVGYFAGTGGYKAYASTEAVTFEQDVWYHVAMTLEDDGVDNGMSVLTYYCTPYGETDAIQLGDPILIEDCKPFDDGDGGMIWIGEMQPGLHVLKGDIDELRWSNTVRTDFNLYESFGGPTLPGDLNGDGQVNSGDLDLVRGNWGSTVSPGTSGDANNDGFVNSADLDIVRGNWGSSLPASVPEPGTTLLVVLASALFGIRRR